MLTQLSLLINFHKVGTVGRGEVTILGDGARKLLSGETLDIGGAGDGDGVGRDGDVESEESLGSSVILIEKRFSAISASAWTPALSVTHASST